MWNEFLTAIGLLLIMEGLTPFLSPKNMRNLFAVVSQLADNQLRTMGFIAIVLGCSLLYFTR